MAKDTFFKPMTGHNPQGQDVVNEILNNEELKIADKRRRLKHLAEEQGNADAKEALAKLPY